ncbi:MAG: hypothetical protein OXH78_06890, partial [Acidimicrobiaceae bacterium]|nr:hypothetical protein [Acidimicrobiaceae bacterium]
DDEEWRVSPCGSPAAWAREGRGRGVARVAVRVTGRLGAGGPLAALPHIKPFARRNPLPICGASENRAGRGRASVPVADPAGPARQPSVTREGLRLR